MNYCQMCGSELDEISEGRYRCTNPGCELADVDVDVGGKELPPATLEVSNEIAEIRRRLGFSKIAPIAEKLLPYIAATLDWGMNPEWKTFGVLQDPPSCFDPWFLDDVCVNTGLEAGDIDYFCRILRPFAKLEEIYCEYHTGLTKPYRFKKRRSALSPALVEYLKSVRFERNTFPQTGIELLRAYFLLSIVLTESTDPFKSLFSEFDDKEWRWLVSELERAHYFSSPVLGREKTLHVDGEVKSITLFQPGRFYVFRKHFFGASGRERGPPEEKSVPVAFTGHPAFLNSISGLRTTDIARQLRNKLAKEFEKELEKLRKSKATLLSLRQSLERSTFMKDSAYEPQVLEELQEEGLIEIEGGVVIPSPSFSEYRLYDFIKKKNSEIVRHLKTWLDIPDK